MTVVNAPARSGSVAVIRRRLARPVDSSMLAAFRMAFGAVVAWELWRYFRLDRPTEYFVDPVVRFTYWPFDWVQPLPGRLMPVLFVVLAVIALHVAAGAFTRATSWLLAIGLAYIFLLDRTHYLNHWYLMVLLAVLLAVTPAGADLSVDTWLRPERRRRTVPAWSVGILRAQLAIVYFYGGLAKLDGEWLAGRPLTLWLGRKGDVPVIGPLLVNEGVGIGMAWASTLFDLLIVPLMIWPRTRRFAYVVAIAFHLLNSRLFTIGVFPWAMLLVTAVFFPCDMPRRMWTDLRDGHHRWPTILVGVLVGAVSLTFPRRPEIVTGVVGALAGAVAGYNLVADVGSGSTAATQPDEDEYEDGAEDDDGTDEDDDSVDMGAGASVDARGPTTTSLAVTAFLAFWMAVQLLVPLRHYVYPGNASWTEEGHQFAWRMMLRSKTGQVEFVVDNPATGDTAQVDVAQILTEEQLDQVATEPDMMVQLAHWIEEELAPGLDADDLRVRAVGEVSFNGRAPAPLVDPEVDLTTVQRPWRPGAVWIEPLPPREDDGE